MRKNTLRQWIYSAKLSVVERICLCQPNRYFQREVIFMKPLPQFRKFSFLISSFILAFSSSGQAQPSISSVEGNFLNGGTVEIVGNAFSNVDARPFFYDLVDNQPAIKSLSDGSTVPEENGLWSANTNQWGNPVTVSKDPRDLRSRNQETVYYGSVKSYLGWPTPLKNTTNSSLYVSWWYKPNQTIDKGGSNKFIRIWDDPSGEATRISWTQMHLTYGHKDSSEVNWSTAQPRANQWNRFEISVDSDSKTITSWLNGKIIHNVNNFNKQPSNLGLNVALIGFDPSINSNYSNLNFAMTDIFVSPTSARVEISDSSSWNPESQREVQKVLSWSDRKVEFELNLFTFNDASELYTYVIDKNGNVNSKGFPLRGCQTCPTSPTGVLIK